MTTQVYSKPIEDSQRKAIFAAARSKNPPLSIDDIRALTPKGSISKLTSKEAYHLLQRLNAGTEYDRPSFQKQRRERKPRRPKGLYAFVTDAQRDMITALRIELGWTDQGLKSWLGERHYPRQRRTLDVMESSHDAVFVIELLKEVRDRTAKLAQKRHEAAQAAKEESCPF